MGFRRIVRLAASAMLAAGFLTGAAKADDKVIHIGFQKYGKLVLLKSKGTLDAKLKPLGYRAEWKEFPSGPPLLEALNAGSVDFGNTGETPPIFAQAGGVPLIYVAYEPPVPKGEAILIPANSTIKSITDLKGKTVALNKGSNVHYLLVKALEKAGVKYSEIKPAYLAPADARAAFERGSIDAWVIWDPYQAAAEATGNAKVLADGVGEDGKNIVSNHQFYLSSRKFLENADNQKALDVVLEQLREVDTWAKTDIHAVAEQLSPSVGLPVPVLEVALKRQSYGIKPVNGEVLAEQQRIADTFFALGLIPKAIKVSQAVRSGS